jgi:hypothetical protein
MEQSTKTDLLVAWRCLAAVLIYPITVVAGLNALVRILSGCCVALDAWTPEGALGNLALGFPALAGIASIWLSTVHPADRIARDRVRFVLVATGLMTGMVMECLFLRAGFVQGVPRFRSPSVYDLWAFGGPLIAGVVNLLLLIRAREEVFAVSAPAPHALQRRLDPPHHGPVDQVLRPVVLKPFRHAVATPSKPGY